MPPGGTGIRVPSRRGDAPIWANTMFYQPSSPLAAIRKLVPKAVVDFDGGSYLSTAVTLAHDADVAIVFATQWMTEGADAPDFSLPDGQDALISAIAAANPNTIVVLETGGPVAMPWLSRVRGVIEAWYPGARGGEAIANILFGETNPSGKLPITFPQNVAQLPRPKIPGFGLPPNSKIDVNYDIEGADVGYRWFARKGLKPLFAFGLGLSYTSFTISDFSAQGGKTVSASFKLANNGTRDGAETAQLYLLDAGKKKEERLLGFAKADLKSGEDRTLTISADRRLLANYDEGAHRWRIDAGNYKVGLGTSSEDIKSTATITLDGDLF
jgi:beta-glucosidase